MDLNDFEKKIHSTDYQVAFSFRTKFQKSKGCLKFRIAWGIPQLGFKNSADYYEWDKEHVKQINAYNKSEKYKEHQQKIKNKRQEYFDRKITEFDFKWYAQGVNFANPNFKFSYDIDQITLNSGMPIYWRDYIEECLLFENPRVTFPSKPLPEPTLKWNEMYQFYELIIDNIFPDTTTKDFDNKKFTKKLKELKLKIPGGRTPQSRKKKNFEFGIELLELDKQKPELSDFEKTETIKNKSLIDNLDIVKERKIKNNTRQIRKRTKKYIGNIE